MAYTSPDIVAYMIEGSAVAPCQFTEFTGTIGGNIGNMQTLLQQNFNDFVLGAFDMSDIANLPDDDQVHILYEMDNGVKIFGRKNGTYVGGGWVFSDNYYYYAIAADNRYDAKIFRDNMYLFLIHTDDPEQVGDRTLSGKLFWNNGDTDCYLGISSFRSGSAGDLDEWYNEILYGSVMSKTTGGGGGATHIAKVTGQLKDLSNNLLDILIVSGGGGGGLLMGSTQFEGKDAGGISGSGDNSGNQSTGNAFGLGETGTDASGGGGGLYGGYKGTSSKSGGAGSGYIGNNLLIEKKMIGYNVPTSSAESTKTESVNIYSETAETNKPKAGNGFARITYKGDAPIPPTPIEYEFDYTGAIQTFTAPQAGHYKIELWGAQGGGVDKVDNNGSYGGYACAEIDLAFNEELYIGVGGQGGNPGLGNNNGVGGYNGGGAGGKAYQSSYHAGGGGGGATHIATTTNRGELKNYSGNTSEVLIVAGGGGGCSDWWDLAVQVGFFTRFYVGSGGGISGGHGDEYQGTQPSGGTQSTGYAFGLGANGQNGTSAAGAGEGNCGGGGGYYGGFSGSAYHNSTGAGGSGYIGNARLSNKHMAGFEVTESSDTDTATTNVAVHSSTPTADAAKEGNGHVRITWLHY